MLRKQKRLGFLAISCLCLLRLDAADLNGAIKDTNGAAIGGAVVRIRPTSGGVERQASTTNSGKFQIEGLEAGEYSIVVEHAGFVSQTRSIRVEPGAPTAPQDFELSAAGTEPKPEGKGRSGTDSVYRQLRTAEPAETWSVENLVLERDAAKFVLKQGAITFLKPVMGRVTQGVFIGQGEFSLKPATQLEAQYVRLSAGAEALTDHFEQAVFVFTDTTESDIRNQAKFAPLHPKAAGTLEEFRRLMRRRPENPRSPMEAALTSEDMDNLEAETLASLYGRQVAGLGGGFFNAYVKGRRFSDLRFLMRPGGAMPSLPATEEVALISVDPSGERDGVLYLSHTLAEIKSGIDASEDKRTVSALAYAIETVIAKNAHLTAVANFEFEMRRDGERVIKFGLLPSLRVTRVSRDSAEIPFIQEDRRSDGSFYVLLPEAAKKGSRHKLRIEYQGDKVIHNEGGGNFAVGARTSWYPSVNAFQDHARFDLTFKVPKRYTLVSVGKKASETREDDFTVTRWVSDLPLTVAGFNYGEFKRKAVTDSSTGYEFEGYATSALPDYLKGAEQIGGMTPTRLVDNALVEAQNSIRLYSHWFGPSPYGRIAITQQPQFSFGQSWPSLVYLPIVAFFDPSQRFQLMGGFNSSMTSFIEEVTPHEVAHQWWGHMVGWSSFHDQWISEGFAQFSAGLYLEVMEKDPQRLIKFWERQRDTILEKNQFGRRANDAGPIWMGFRLDSARNPTAYSRLVYPKGAYVLRMIRTMMWDPKTGDENFIRMMREFVESHKTRNASTESFMSVVEKYMTPSMDPTGTGRKDMAWFFLQWVMGTEIPKYEFSYQVEPAQEGQWRLTGKLTQSDVSEYFYMPVPLYLDFDGKFVRAGSIRISGSRSVDLSILLPKKPKRVLVNARYDVLAQK